MKFGEVLLRLIEENELALTNLPEALRISESMLNNFIRCAEEPDFDTLKRIAVFFNVRTDDLLDYQGVSNKSEHQMEDELLQTFSDMPPKQRQIFLELGRVTARVCAAEGVK